MAHEFGGPEVLKIEDRKVGEPAPGQVRLRHTAIGVNFADILMVQGRNFPKVELPTATGREAAAVVEAVGPGVNTLKRGQRVVYTSLLGAFSDECIAPADKLYPLPDGIDDKFAAAVFLKGLTAEYLLHATYPLQSGQTVLVHAAAGGVGSLLAQWARHIGAVVIGTVGSDDKVPAARANGCHHVINYAKEDFAARCKEITGKGVDVIYDGVGKSTFEGNMEACAVRGRFINYGHASGVPGPIDAMRINAKSMWFNTSNMFNYLTSRADGERMSAHVFEAVAKGILKPRIERVYALTYVAKALSDVTDRKTTGSVIVVP